jgi:hypothetical protein
MLREIHEPDVAIWAGVICWNPRTRQLIELPAADHSTSAVWVAQTKAAARACLPDDPALVAP